ncbi:MAG: FecR domain-containing protein [Bacteroidota bacterium]
MTSKNDQRRIAKYLGKQATLSERDELESWLEDVANHGIFKEYIKANYLINLSMDLYDSDNSKKQLLRLIEKEKKQYRLKRFYRAIKYAAAILFLIGIAYVFKNGYFTEAPKVKIPSDSITLQLENGNIEVINENGTTQVLDAEGKVVGAQKGNQLVYDDDAQIRELRHNTLTVPFGKQFEVKLSDGTKIYMNAGSVLKYPVKFIAGNKREVFLTGEAFFDVAPDSTHVFVVNAKTLNVEVLGTAFNVSAYPEDFNTDVVLVEGSVGMYANTKTLSEGTMIKPGFRGSFNELLKKTTTEAVDVGVYTSWMDGSLVFRNMPLKSIVRKLERQYNMEIIIVNEELKDETFNATFRNKPPLDKILNSFRRSYGIKHTIKDNAIYIN